MTLINVGKFMPVLKETLEMLEINEGGGFFFFSFAEDLSFFGNN